MQRSCIVEIRRNYGFFGRSFIFDRIVVNFINRRLGDLINEANKENFNTEGLGIIRARVVGPGEDATQDMPLPPFIINASAKIDIDFEKKIFRMAKPDDYVSLCTNLDYFELDENNTDHMKMKNEIEEFMHELFPQEELYKYMWQHLASSLKGTNENQVFDRLSKRLGLTERYKTGTHKITIHSMRAFFISKMIKVNENFGHALSGHSSYMKQYERLEIHELVEAYIKSEPELTIIDLTRKDDEISKLRNSNTMYNDLSIKYRMLEDLLKSLPIDPKILEQKAREINEEDYID